ncbi:hypothetical protein EGW53_09225 [Enterococcus faecium]|uniref:hypothetical protein n=1 Tax=Enterococcus faecium TaxID=1352 RepID=UPI000F4D39D6|nr:hypothetical protein [Enterococcus faecium]ROW95143.1 hypothetical protein EGW09_10340 [Enterococcus faecium]ROX48171.1 hypothetical protein EGW18_10340 [Enterococcus faecium]ROX51306.1 hypothetical protein EGW14_09225 [Enterococcus faecium]ROY06251.1 hypothetical protein EGW53_09225 [Enterococcus faecium]ROY29661.1 hypothetical protein EGW50_10040 [Enterococcus faecium]
MNEYQTELFNNIQSAGLSEVSASAILENSGVLEAIERHGAAIPSVEEYKQAELEALASGTPITLAMNELIGGYKQKFDSLSNARQEQLLERIVEKVAPPENAFQERINQLETAFNTELQSGSVERATELYNELESLSEAGKLPSYEKPKKTLPSDQEIAAMGVSQQSALLYEFPEHSRHILEVIQEV